MNKTTWAIVLAGVFGLGLVITATGAQSGGLGSSAVAVVSVAKVSEAYQRTRDLEAHFEQQRQQYNQERAAKRDQIERGMKALQEQFKPGTPEFKQRKTELLVLQAELQVLEDDGTRELEGKLAASLRDIFADIQGVVAQVAKEQGLDVVLASDEMPEESAVTTSMARQQILLQKVVFWSPRVDITDAVIARINTQYEQKKAAAQGQ